MTQQWCPSREANVDLEWLQSDTQRHFFEVSQELRSRHHDALCVSNRSLLVSYELVVKA